MIFHIFMVTQIPPPGQANEKKTRTKLLFVALPFLFL